MRILVIGRDLPSKENNMLGSFEYEQAQMLAHAGYDVYYPFIDLRSARHWRKFGLIKKERDGVNIIGLNIPIGRALPAFIRNKLYLPLLRWQLKTIGKKYCVPDIVHIHYPSIFQYDVFLPLQKCGAKVVGTEHWSRVQNKSLSPQCLKNLNDFVESADAVCCVGESLKKSIMELTGTKKEITIVPNVVNAVFKPIQESHNGFRFIASGRLAPVKQFDKIIEAFLNVFQGCADISLNLAGDGEEYFNLAEIIKRRDAENQVHLLGMVSRQRMAALIAESDALVVFSELETFCVPVIEAWTCGKPVITTTTTTIFADNPDGRLGVMVDWRDIKSLENAIRYIYDHYSEYDSEWITEYAKRNFSEEAICKQLIRIYTNADKE